MKPKKRILAVVIVLICVFTIGMTSIGTAETQESDYLRDGFIAYDAIVDEKNDLILVGQRVLEVSLDEQLDKDDPQYQVVNVGWYIRWDEKYESRNVIMMGNQAESGGVVDTCIPSVWDMKDGRKLAYFEFSSEEFESEFRIVDINVEEYVKSCDDINELSDITTRTLQKVDAGYLFGGYNWENDQVLPLDTGDSFVFYDNDLHEQWEVTDSTLEGVRYTNVIETPEMYVLYGDAMNVHGDSYPSIYALSKTGKLLWRYDSPELVGSMVTGGAFRTDGSMAFIISNMKQHSNDNTGLLLLMDDSGDVSHTYDLYHDYSMYKLTSIVELSNRLVVCGNYQTDNQAALISFSSEQDKGTLTEVSKDKNGVKQTTHLAKASDSLAHIYGHIEYDDDASRSDPTQKYQSFLLPYEIDLDS